jgi:hypothetical protein
MGSSWGRSWFVLGPVLAFGACSTNGGASAKTSCNGSGLAADPTNHQCFSPPPPTQGCAQSLTAKVSDFATVPAPNTFEAETQVAVDPRPGQNNVFAVTIQSDVVASTTGSPTATCLAAKHIAVFKSTAGGPLVQMTGLPPPPAREWATDPDIVVGPDGTLYLTFLRWIAPCGATNDPTCNTCGNTSGNVTDVELWFAPSGTSVLQPGLADNQTLMSELAPPSLITSFPTQANQLPAIPGTETGADHPLLAVSPVTPGKVVVYVSGGLNARDSVFTFQQPSSTQKLAPSLGTLQLPRQQAPNISNVGGLFANPALDASDNLYLALGFVTDSNNVGHLLVRKFSATPTAWSQVGPDGEPPLVSGATYPFADLSGDLNVEVPSSTTARFLAEFTPALAVGALSGSTDPIVYLAFEILDATGTRQIELTAANGRDVTLWTTPVAVGVPSGGAFAFRPSLSFDGANNILDLLEFDLEPPVGPPGQLTSIGLGTFFYRFDASRLTPVFGPVKLNKAPPAVSDLPTRPEPNLSSVVFPGEYLGLATKAITAFAAWPELSTGVANADLGFADVSGTCGSAITLVDPDSLWECSCQCGGSEAPFFPIVGCASASATTAAAACSEICPGASLCGNSLTCTGGTCNGSFSSGRLLSTQSCAKSDGPPSGAAPASSADFSISDTGLSTATLTVAGQPATTSVTGQAFINSSTSPPRVGSVVEIARLSIQPSDVFVGGTVNAFVRNIGISHRTRLQGGFTDATHFQLAPGAVELVITLQTQSLDGELSAPFNLRASNPTAMAGVLDLAKGTFSIDGTASDPSGSSLALHFAGNVTARPPDSNHNGIIDAVDKCPGESFGPDRTPPVFVSVPPPITISSCVGAQIGHATATDPCGVTITNNAPAKFPLGNTTVIWTARDGAGNVATARQTVTAVLGNDTSCCPAGYKIIVGTSNNDTLVGTSGLDCILGLGGQDTISGGDGDDVISGGDGDDVINGQGGNDRLYGGSGQDTISGGTGNDFIDGGDGVDHLNGDDGNDVIVGGQGGDIIHGGTGNDVISGGADDDQLFGDDGDDQLFGDAGNDSLFGGNGNDSLSGGDGDDKLDGGPGINRLDGGPGHNMCVDNGVSLLQCPGEGNPD